VRLQPLDIVIDVPRLSRQSSEVGILLKDHRPGWMFANISIGIAVIVVLFDEGLRWWYQSC